MSRDPENECKHESGASHRDPRLPILAGGQSSGFRALPRSSGLIRARDSGTLDLSPLRLNDPNQLALDLGANRRHALFCDFRAGLLAWPKGLT